MSDTQKEVFRFLKPAVVAFIFVNAIAFFKPDLIVPFSLFEFWSIKGSLWGTISGAWPLYLWAIGANTIVLIIWGTEDEGSPAEILGEGFLVSLSAGVYEEIAYRWLFFLATLVILPMVDWLVLGFVDIHLIKFVNVSIVAPIANFFTLGSLEDYLLNENQWFVSAAIIGVNSSFRDKHKYLGFIGFINSWFLGMYFFWVLFNCGLVAAIILHFLYDFFIFCTIAFYKSMQINRRWV